MLTALRSNRRIRELASSRYAGISIVLGLMLGLLLYEVRYVGLTVDETSHFAAAYNYWTGDDSLQPADTPPLTRIISGWIPKVLRVRPAAHTLGFAERDAYQIGSEQLGTNRGRRALTRTRLPFLVFPLLIVWIVWRWGTELFSARTALVLAGLCSVEPTILGHGALIKSDVPAACLALWFGYRTWRFLMEPTVRNFGLVTAAVVLGLLTKFTLVILLPIAVAIGLAKVRRIVHLSMLAVLPYLGILLSGGAMPEPVTGTLLEQVKGAGLRWPLSWIADLLVALPWPPQFIKGLVYIHGALHGEGFLGYLNGQKISGWVPEYFPIAFVYKEPIPMLMLFGGGVVMAVMAWRRRFDGLFVAGFAGLFFLAAVFSNFHIGVRHILPSIPFLILAGGWLVEWLLSSRRGQIAVAAICGWAVIELAIVHPNSLSYCNEFAGGSRGCWHHLADSNVDWGQNYRELGRVVERMQGERIRAFLFGYDSPWYYMAAGSLQSMRIPKEGDKVEPYVPTPGYYAISVNYLTGLMLPKGHEDFLAVFRAMPVHSRAGYSILIYRVE